MRTAIRRTGSILLICLLIPLGVALDKADVHANATDTLTFKVGYFGWDSSEYVEKKTFSVSDIKSMSSNSLRAYSYYDASGHRIAIDSAYGADLDTLLNRAGIDNGSISNLAFYTTDSGDGAFATFTMQELVLTDRYYFPDLAAAIGKDGKYVDSDAKRQLWNNAKKVSVALAYQDKWVWYPAETEGAKPTESGHSTANRFRLCFGQSNPLDYRTFQSAKMVETIYVMFSGTPKLTADETDLTGKVGSTHQVKVTAAAADDALEEALRNGAKFSSSDESVARVGADGTIEYVGEGDAIITITSGGASTQVKVHVGDKDSEGGSGNGSGEGNGNGTGNGNGSGRGDSAKGDKNEGKTEVKKPDKTKPDKARTKDKTDKDEEQVVYALSKDASKDLKTALARTAPKDQASMNTYQEGMDGDAKQLEIKKEDDGLLGAVAGIFGIIGIEGALWSFIRFRKSL